MTSYLVKLRAKDIRIGPRKKTISPINQGRRKR
jgi:hypothetical protein